MMEGTEYTTNNSGALVVLRYRGNTNVLVRFVLTGYERVASKQAILRGTVKDPMYPTVEGVGYLGVGEFKPSKHKKMYKTWTSMIRRCYNERVHTVQPTYANCTVSEDWLCFQTFGAWFEKNYVEGHQLDKDIKVVGNTVYSEDTCAFVSPSRNSRAASGTLELVYRLVSPEGVPHVFTEQSVFCNMYGLTPSSVSAVLNGARKSHKGWKL